MRISDWSSDVCSSDLLDVVVRQPEKICARPTALPELEPRPPRLRIAGKQDAPFDHRDSKIGIIHAIEKTVDHGVIEQHVVRRGNEIGRAHVCTTVTNAHLVCRLLLEKKKTATTCF